MAAWLLACFLWSTTTWAALDKSIKSGPLEVPMELEPGYWRNASIGFYAVTMPKRKQHMMRFMKENQLQIQLVPGIPHFTLNGTELQASRQILSRYCEPIKAVALALGHRKALDTFLHSENAYGLIFEDDVILSESQTQEKSYGDRGIV
uniref:Uncharacterized protein n=1 Tax=Lotharella oceanica TaxID=641309 RepID=A0A7S2TPS9_9EUKA